MGLTEGTFELGPEQGRLLLKTGRSGLGSRAGHDLTLEVNQWSGRAVVGDAAGSSVEVSAEVDSITVAEATGGVRGLSTDDRIDIKKNLRKVLSADRHPVITFVSAGVTGTPEDFTIEGDLTIMGRTEKVAVRAAAAGDRVRGSTTVSQSRWGIKPYSAFFGALKLADDVEVSFDLGLD